MNKRYKTAACLLALVMVFTLSGCTSFVGVEGLISPPRLAGDQQEIYNALCKGVNGTPDLVYPVRGSHKSAITLLNIDNEEGNEAIALYKVNPNSTGSMLNMPLRLNVLDLRDGQWVSVYDMGIDADEVEKIDVLVSGSMRFLAVGCNYAGAYEKQLKIYSYQENMLTVAEEFSTINYEICDLDGDGRDEIVKLITASETSSASEPVRTYVEARLVHVDGRIFTSANHVRMFPDVTEYAEVHVGNLLDGTPAIYIDGIMGTQMVSEILICDRAGRLRNLLYNGGEASAERVLMTQRQAGIYAADVDGNGTYGIPQMLPAPGYEDKERYEQLYFTSWSCYNAAGSRRSYLSYTDFSLGYLLRMPSSWKDLVTAEYSAVDNEITFYEYVKDMGMKGLPILSVRVMSRSRYTAEGVSGKYQVLMTSGQLVFLYYSHNDISSLSLSRDVIRDSLYLLN